MVKKQLHHIAEGVICAPYGENDMVLLRGVQGLKHEAKITVYPKKFKKWIGSFKASGGRVSQKCCF